MNYRDYDHYNQRYYEDQKYDYQPHVAPYGYNGYGSSSQYEQKAYLNDLHYEPYQRQDYYEPYKPQPISPYADPNNPINLPYVPHAEQSLLFDKEVGDFIHRLPQYTKYSEEIAFAVYLAQNALIDSRLTGLQNELNRDMRFNSRLLFDYFDQRRNGQIDFNEFKWGLNKLDIHFRNQECYNLFSRVANEDNQISQTEFHEMLVGFFDEPARFFQLGAQSYMHLPFNRQQKEQYLTMLQRTLINDIMDLQLQVERDLINLRSQMNEEIIFALFRQLDRASKGFLVQEDLLQYLRGLGGDFFTPQDLEIAFYRISKLKSDRINFSEFSAEFHPLTQERLDKTFEQQGSPARKRQQNFIELMHKQHEETKKALELKKINDEKIEQQRKLDEEKRAAEQNRNNERTIPQRQRQYSNSINSTPNNPRQEDRGQGSRPNQRDFSQGQESPLPERKDPLPQKPIPESDIADMFFPGFQKYQLRKPQV